MKTEKKSEKMKRAQMSVVLTKFRYGKHATVLLVAIADPERAAAATVVTAY